ncbi:hypothetical protein DL89DRAFT_268427, partial [Linderina pennispora]
WVEPAKKPAAAQAIYFSQVRQRTAEPKTEAETGDLVPHSQAQPEQDANEQSETGMRIANILKLLLFGWFLRWFLRYFEVDRSLRGEPETPQISMTWMYLAAVAVLPFAGVYVFASIWKRRILGESLDLQNWQAGANSLVHIATTGLLLAWVFAVIGLFPGYGFKSLLITAVTTVCSVALADAVEGIF